MPVKDLSLVIWTLARRVLLTFLVRPVSALATARIIEDVGQISYPEGIKSPAPDLNINAPKGKFRYDRDFLLQFMVVCQENPKALPRLRELQIAPDSANAGNLGRPPRTRQPSQMGPPARLASGVATKGVCTRCAILAWSERNVKELANITLVDRGPLILPRQRSHL